jgi:hypothetical protein
MTSCRLPPTILPVALGTMLLAGAAGMPALGATYSSRIVNGTLSGQYPSTGALAILSRSDASVAALCSGTMIGCETFLTAAHCVCPEGTTNADTCVRAGVTDPALLRVFLQHAGLFGVASVAVNPDFGFETGGDDAIIHLAEPVSGVAGTAIDDVLPVPFGTTATIVGFGRTGGNPDLNVNAGVKRFGQVVTGNCTAVPNDTHVCWTFRGADSNTCEGDSGGPLFVDLQSGTVVAGVHAGGTSATCLPVDMAFDTSVFADHAWIASEAGADQPETSCGGLPAAGSLGTSITATAGDLSNAQPQGFASFSVPPGTTRLRVALNGQVFSIVGSTEVRNDFDLYVAKDRPPTLVDYDCADARPGPFGFCEFETPAPGTWFALANRVRGTGTYQLTATTFAATCRGDCAGDGTVTVDDLLVGVNIALNLTPLSACPSFAAPGSDTVSVDDILVAVNNALGGCPAAGR